MSKLLRLPGLDPTTKLPIAVDILLIDTPAGGVLGVATPIGNNIQYEDSTHKYYCNAIGGAKRSDPLWQIVRITIADNTTTAAGNTSADFGLPLFTANDLATVVAHTYNNGVPL